LSPTEPVSPTTKLEKIKKVNIVGGKGTPPIRRNTTFRVIKATGNGMEEHALDMETGDGRLWGSKFMDRFKELLDPKKPWDGDDTS
jgi:hypothetical protein